MKLPFSLARCSVAVAAVWLLASSPLAPSQAEQRPKVGYLGFGAAALPTLFQNRLRELGYSEGTNVSVEYRFAEGRAGTLPRLARELVDARVDVIMAMGDEAIVGGLSGVHQFVRIGRGAMIGALSMVTADVIPHGLVSGPRGRLEGLNLIGLKRRGAGRAEIAALRRLLAGLEQGAFRETARQRADQATLTVMEREILDFILGPSERGFLTPGADA